MYNKLNNNSPETVSGTPFVTAPFSGKNAFWRYFIGVITPFLASNLIGALPLLAVMMTSTVGGVVPQKGGMPDFEAMGVNLNLGFTLTVFPFILAFLAIIFLVKPLHERSFATVISTGQKNKMGTDFLFCACMASNIRIWLIYSLKTDPGNFRMNNTSTSLIVLAILALVLIPFQAAFEEILFRVISCRALSSGHETGGSRYSLPRYCSLMHGLNPEVKEYGFLTMIPSIFSSVLSLQFLPCLMTALRLPSGLTLPTTFFSRC
jgi:membrane protease YdiL (CAAX protease family)